MNPASARTRKQWLLPLVLSLFLSLCPAVLQAQQKYKTTVPDTLDLVDYASYGINSLTQTLDPAFNYEIFFRANLGTNPPYLQHDTTGLPTNNPKFAESLPMMRVMSGSDRFADVDQKMMKLMLDNIGKDGLFYVPYSERRTWHEGVGHNYNKQFHRDFANVYGNSRLLLAMVAWYEKDKDPMWKPYMQALAHGLCQIAIRRGDYAYYPDSQIGEAFSYAKELGWLRTEEPAVERTGAEGSMFMYHCGPIRALARYYALTGDREALDTAAALVRYVMKPQFWGAESEKPWGATSAQRGQWVGHPHAHIATLRALLEYAWVTRDAGLIDFVRQSYEYARTHYGLPRIGMFGEGCTNADMVAISIMLCDAGAGDYWDDADMYVRNHLIESMFTSPERIEQVIRYSPKSDPKSPQDSTDEVVRRSVGVVGSPAMTCMTPFSIGCCTGNLTQAIYYAWESIVRSQHGTAQVNLLLNRASPWLDVESHLPYEGKVLVKNKTSRRAAIRIPSWVDRSKLAVQLNGQPASTFWVGNFVVVEGMKANDAIALEFPVKEAKEEYTSEGRTYALTFRGNTLVDVSPRDDRGYYAIYQRDELKQAKAPTRDVTRYVSPVIVKWWSGIPSD